MQNKYFNQKYGRLTLLHLKDFNLDKLKQLN